MARNDSEPEAGAAVPVRLGPYGILPNQPLPELSAPHAAACRVVNQEHAADSFYALVVGGSLPPRHVAIASLADLSAEGIVAPVAAGVLDWPAAGRCALAVVLDRPGGRRFVERLDQSVAPVPPDVVIHAILPPLLGALRALFATGQTHRAIRPTNLFYRTPASPQLMLGECVSAPPAMHQPVFCEPIESAFALPVARGDGTPADDLYALGASLMFLLLGGNPVAELDDEQLLAEKMNRGSYAALLGKSRIPSAMVEPVRGLLADDPRERWTLQELDFWLQGRRLVPRQYSLSKHATRPYEFGGRGLYTARGLAQAFSRDAGAAMRAVKSPEFDVWMQRSLAEPERTDALATALSGSPGGGVSGIQEERLLARVCIALDPLAPIRYRGFAAAIDGFGTALATAFLGGGNVGVIAEALATRLPQFWFAAQTSLRPEHMALLKVYERLRLLLDDRRPGFGIERILYELNPGLHCLAPLLEGAHVADAVGLLRAYEKAAAGGRLETVTVDRHTAAFIAARFRGITADWHDPLASSDPAERTLGALLILARLQSLRGPAELPALAQRFAGQLPPLVERFHNRPKRARLIAELPKLAGAGDLMDLLTHVDNPADRALDTQGFAAAQREHRSIGRALEVLRVGAPARLEHAAELGGRFAVTAASVLAWLAAVGAVVLAGRGGLP